jgi:flagellar protein FliL
MGKILPILLAVIGLGAGVGGGIALRPDPNAVTAEASCNGQALDAAATADAKPAETPVSAAPDYVKLNNQFVIPVVSQGSVKALVVLALSLEISSGGPELVYKREPKLRDTLLQVLFDHANMGGFDGNFTASRNMDQLRTSLKEAAQKILGPAVTDVLIVDVVRQDT